MFSTISTIEFGDFEENVILILITLYRIGLPFMIHFHEGFKLFLVSDISCIFFLITYFHMYSKFTIQFLCFFISVSHFIGLLMYIEGYILYACIPLLIVFYFALRNFFQSLRKCKFNPRLSDSLVLLYPIASASVTMIISLLKFDHESEKQVEYEINLQISWMIVVTVIKLNQVYLTTKYLNFRRSVSPKNFLTTQQLFIGLIVIALLFLLPIFESLLFYGVISENVFKITFASVVILSLGLIAYVYSMEKKHSKRELRIIANEKEAKKTGNNLEEKEERSEISNNCDRSVNDISISESTSTKEHEQHINDDINADEDKNESNNNGNIVQNLVRENSESIDISRSSQTEFERLNSILSADVPEILVSVEEKSNNHNQTAGEKETTFEEKGLKEEQTVAVKVFEAFKGYKVTGHSNQYLIILVFFVYKATVTFLLLSDRVLFRLPLVSDHCLVIAIVCYFRIYEVSKQIVLILGFFGMIGQFLVFPDTLLRAAVYSLIAALYAYLTTIVMKAFSKLTFGLSIFDVTILLYPMFFYFPLFFQRMFSFEEGTYEMFEYEVDLKIDWTIIITILKSLQIYLKARFFVIGGYKLILKLFNWVEYLRFSIILLLLLSIPVNTSLFHYEVVTWSSFIPITFASSAGIVAILLFHFSSRFNDKVRSRLVMESRVKPMKHVRNPIALTPVSKILNEKTKTSSGDMQ